MSYFLNVLIEFKIAITATPTSANTAKAIVLIPNAPNNKTINFTTITILFI